MGMDLQAQGINLGKLELSGGSKEEMMVRIDLSKEVISGLLYGRPVVFCLQLGSAAEKDGGNISIRRSFAKAVSMGSSLGNSY